MKLHTRLEVPFIYGALHKVKQEGHVTDDIHFVEFDEGRSRTHQYRYEIQLGTYDKTTGPTRSRRFKNTGQYGAGQVWSATYDEWGYFIEQIFRMDPGAKFGPYKNMTDLYAVWNRERKSQ